VFDQRVIFLLDPNLSLQPLLRLAPPLPNDVSISTEPIISRDGRTLFYLTQHGIGQEAGVLDPTTRPALHRPVVANLPTGARVDLLMLP
jgi:hypothetical protein